MTIRVPREAKRPAATGRVLYASVTCAYAADRGFQRLIHRPDVLEDVFAVPRKALSEPSTVARSIQKEATAGYQLRRLRPPG